MKVEIEFVADIVGHNIETIKQMYNDWCNSPKIQTKDIQAETRAMPKTHKHNYRVAGKITTSQSDK